MDESTKFAAQCARFPTSSLASAYVAAELEQLHLQARIATVNRQMRRERRMRAYRHWVTFWPVALGILMGAYAPLLRDLAASYSPWAATVLFPLSTVMQQHGFNFSSITVQTLSQVLLFAQFPLDGLLACLILKHRPTMMGVCGQVAGLHTLAVLYVALVSGSFNQFLPN